MSLFDHIKKELDWLNRKVILFILLVMLLSLSLAWYMLSNHYPAIPSDPSREERDRDQ